MQILPVFLPGRDGPLGSVANTGDAHRNACRIAPIRARIFTELNAGDDVVLIFEITFFLPVVATERKIHRAFKARGKAKFLAKLRGSRIALRMKICQKLIRAAQCLGILIIFIRRIEIGVSGN